MTALWVPRCGDSVVLTEKWSFTLTYERRNDGAFAALGGKLAFGRAGSGSIQASFAADTELVFDRMYIRQPASDYDSITFVVKKCPVVEHIGLRFWVPIDVANEMHCVRGTSGNPVGIAAPAAFKATAKLGDEAYAKKKAAAVESKQRLLAYKERIVEECRTNHGMVAAHVDDIISAIIGNDRYIHRDWARTYLMSPTGRSNHYDWKCVKSTPTLKEFRFCYYGRLFSGFTLKLNADKSIASIEPLV